MRGVHLHRTVDLGQIAVRYHLGRLVANANLEASGAPVNELDGALGLQGRHGSMRVLGYHVATVKQAGRHVFPIAWIALDHLVVWLEARHGDFLDGERLVRSLRRRHDWGVGDKWEVYARVGHKIDLEFVQIHVQGTVEAKRSSDGRHN